MNSISGKATGLPFGENDIVGVGYKPESGSGNASPICIFIGASLNSSIITSILHSKWNLGL